jgi:arsenate reductase
MISLYGIRSCDTCRKALKWLQAHDIEHEYVDIRETGLNKAVVGHWQESVNWEGLLNRRSITWRKIPECDRAELNPNKARDLILDYPTVMKRPLLDLGNRVVLGFSEAEYESLDL